MTYRNILWSMLIGCAAMTLAGGEMTVNVPRYPDTVRLGAFQTTTGALLPDDTGYEIGFSDQALHISADFHHAVDNPPKAACRINDSEAVFGDDCAEILLSHTPGKYYHLCFNAKGAAYSAFCQVKPDGSIMRDSTWNPVGINRKVVVSPNGWQVILTIPYAAFGPGVSAASAWRGNFARSKQDNPAYVASWTGSDNFNDMKTFGRLNSESGKAGAVVTRLRLTPGSVQSVVAISQAHECELTAAVDNKPLFRRTVPARDCQIKMDFELPMREIPLKRNSELLLKLTACDGKQVWSRKAHFQLDIGRALTLDGYYYRPGGKLQWRSNFPVIAGRAPVAVSGKITGAKSSLAVSGAEGELELKSLTPGRYFFELTADYQGRSMTSGLLFYICDAYRMPKIAATDKLAVTGTTFSVGGRAAYLLSGSPTGKSFLPGDDAFNLDYGNYGVCPNAVKIYGFPGGRLVRSPRGTGYLFAPAEQHDAMLAKALARVDAVRTLGRISYEAQMKCWSGKEIAVAIEENAPEWYTRVNAVSKKAAPGMPTTLHVDKAEQLERFGKIPDIVEAAFWSSSYAADMLRNLDADQRTMRRAVPGKPLIFWLGGTIPNASVRTAEEIRGGVYASMINGFAGNIIHMGHGFLPPERKRLWSVLAQLGPEINSVFPLFAAGREVKIFAGAVPENFIVGARELPSGRLLIAAVNTSGGKAELPLPLPSAYRRGEMLLEKSEVEIPRDGKLRLPFTAYEPRLLLLSKN